MSLWFAVIQNRRAATSVPAQFLTNCSMRLMSEITREAATTAAARSWVLTLARGRGALHDVELERRRHQRAGIGLLRRARRCASAGPASTILPSFITTTSCASARTTRRSWLMKR